MARQTPNSGGTRLQLIAGPLVRVYKAGGYLLTFIFIGAVMMLGSKVFPSDVALLVTILGAVLTFACLGLFAWGYIHATQESGRELAEVRKFCKRLTGYWWERIESEEGSVLSFFSIEEDPYSNSVRLGGISYDKDGKPAASWNSAMSRVVLPENKVQYLWQGKHPKKDPNVDFHGFGEITFPGPQNSATPILRGEGRFWSVDQSKTTAIVKTVELRRIPDRNPGVDIMQNGPQAKIAELIKHTQSEW